MNPHKSPIRAPNRVTPIRRDPIIYALCFETPNGFDHYVGKTTEDRLRTRINEHMRCHDEGRCKQIVQGGATLNAITKWHGELVAQEIFLQAIFDNGSGCPGCKATTAHFALWKDAVVELNPKVGRQRHVVDEPQSG